MLNTIPYDARRIVEEIVWALKKSDVDTLVECQHELETHNDEHVLLLLSTEEYAQYHGLLSKTSIKEEVAGRNNKGLA